MRRSPSPSSFASFFTGRGEEPALVVNGQAISKDEYIKLLERATIQQPGGQPTKVERLVIDTIVSNQVILAEAGKAGLLPSEREVARFHYIQKLLMERQQPDKKYEEELAKQGISPDEVMADLLIQMAETNLYARKLKLSERDLRTEYDENRDKIGLPPRTWMRLIVLPPNSPETQQAKKLFASGRSFEYVAKTVNNPELRATGGEQVFDNSQLPPAINLKCSKLKSGDQVGPIDWVIPSQPGQPAQAPLKAWIKLIRRLPALSLPYEDAAPILKRDLVQNRIMDPANASKRDEILKIKLRARLQSDDPLRLVVWDDIKKVARDMGVGSS